MDKLNTGDPVLAADLSGALHFFGVEKHVKCLLVTGEEKQGLDARCLLDECGLIL